MAPPGAVASLRPASSRRFLVGFCSQWEAAAEKRRLSGVVALRIGIVLGATAAASCKMLRCSGGFGGRSAPGGNG